MRASYEWLCDLAGIHDLSPEEVAQTLTMAGFNVDSLERIDRSAILIGRVVGQQPHPTSRNPLWVHQVDLGEKETRQIIAGRPNAGPGSLVPVALPGTTVPNGRFVRDAEIAGVPGRGMLCSAEELLLPPEPVDGILVLEEGIPGQHLNEVIPDDAVLDVEVEPNRPDCLGHLHLARELAAARGETLARDVMPPFTGGIEPPGVDLARVEIEAPDLCRRYIGAVISGVTMGPSPAWLRRRLFTAGVRPLNNLVDVTLYVALEFGQPLHAFDLRKLDRGPDGKVDIRVRRGIAGETLHCLDGQTRELTPDMLAIASPERALAVAGVIGGADTAVDDKTTDLLLEAACFDGPSVRATSRALKLRTEASTRNEKGLSPELALAGARRAASLYREVAGGQVHIEWVDVYPEPLTPVRVSFRPERVDHLLGTKVPPEEMEAILRRLGFSGEVADGVWHVFPPVFRLDVRLVEDVVEEVGRIYGYDKVPPTLPGRRRAGWHVPEPSLEQRLDPARHALAGAGYTEIVGPSIVSSSLLRRLGGEEEEIRIANPISEEQDALRTTLAATLAQAATHNEERLRSEGLRLFEVGRAYLRRPGARSDEQADEPYRIGILDAVGDEPSAGREALIRVKGAFERAALALGPHRFSYVRASGEPLLHPGRAATVLVDGREAGRLGELHPLRSRALGLPGRLVLLEVDAQSLLRLETARRYQPLPRFPAV
ncbi:MAG: phenylalanine--tRNA ligase subunit beta, partial [Candidatus Dormibacteraeota bacterium]|nr:phenylalanine--tRNA ligase subunit beta [Candidatus Dormibacteraeota bacterium]